MLKLKVFQKKRRAKAKKKNIKMLNLSKTATA